MLKHCALCGGDVVFTKMNYVVDIDNITVVISDVPCLQCQKCGERYFGDDVSKRLDAIIADLHKGNPTPLQTISFNAA